MRPVMVSQVVWTPYVPRTDTEPAKPSQKTMLELGQAMFHQFGAQFEELPGGVGNYTVAIIEWPGGRVEQVMPECIRFFDTPGEESVERVTVADFPFPPCNDFVAQVTVRRAGNSLVVESAKVWDPRHYTPLEET